MYNSDSVRGSSSPQYLSISKEKPPLSPEQTKTNMVFGSRPHYEGVTSDSPHDLSNDFSLLFADNSPHASSVKTESSQKVEESRFHPKNMHDMAAFTIKDGKVKIIGLVKDNNHESRAEMQEALSGGEVRFFDIKSKVFHVKKGEQIDIKQFIFSPSVSPEFKAIFKGQVTYEYHDQEEFDEMHSAFNTYINEHPVESKEVKNKEVQEEKSIRKQGRVRSGEIEGLAETKKSSISPQNLQIIQDIVFSMIQMSERKFQKKMEKIEEEQRQENVRVVREEIKEKELEKQINKPRFSL